MFRRRKPRPLIAKATPELQQEYKKLTLLAKRDDIDLWFEDKCHFQQRGSRCAMWIHSEIKDPIVLNAPVRKHIGVFGAVRVADGTLVSERASTFNTVSFHGFLKRLFRRHRKGSKMVVIVDNARWHHAKSLFSGSQSINVYCSYYFYHPTVQP